MTALGASTMLLLVATILLASRRWALLAMVAGILYLTQHEGFTVAGFNVYAYRFLEVAGLLRILVRREHLGTPRNRLDVLLVVLYAYTVTVFLIRSNEGGQAYQIGTAADAYLCYFTFRTLVADFEDCKWLLRGLAVLLLPYVPLLVDETLRFHNHFTAFGSVALSQGGDLWVRNGRLRALGSFGHPSLLGTFGGAHLPLYIALLFSRGNRGLALLGATLCLTIVWASNSGGPALCAAIAVLGWLLWPFRNHMSAVRISSVVALIGLSLVMNAPVWFIFARISTVTGGDGWHRSELVDTAVRHLGQWWLAGTPLVDTADWLPDVNPNTGGVDMTNNYLVFGIVAGLGAVILLIASLTRAFRSIGLALASVRAVDVRDENERILWGLGVMLSVHLFNWFGITYWDQTNAMWFLHLALISSLTGAVTNDSKYAATTPFSPPLWRSSCVGVATSTPEGVRDQR